MSLSMFEDDKEFQSLGLIDAEVQFIRSFYTDALALQTLAQLSSETPWQQDRITLWGKQHWQPRLSAWYGDTGTRYAYSGLMLEPRPWTPALQAIRQDIETATGHRFNSVLLNLYRNEQDSMGWHSDDEAELGAMPVIASLSLGETRTFKLRHKTRPQQKTIAIDLTNGSLLVMAGTTQQFWQHGIDKERKSKGPRVNLTFRTIFKRQQVKNST
jgi:alkylated DNA repair dioxygenase AlkB